MKLTYESENLFAKIAWRNPKNPNDYQLDVQATGETFQRILNLAAAGLCDDGDYDENEKLLNQLYEIKNLFR